jgi:hypothetical protein
MPYQEYDKNAQAPRDPNQLAKQRALGCFKQFAGAALVI